MSQYQSIKRLLLPVIKGLPWIIAFMLIFFLFAVRMLYYATPIYEGVSKIKLADSREGASNANLYKDFDYFANSTKIEAEVELLKSQELVSATLDSLDFDVTYVRTGKIRNMDMYHESPFLVLYDIKNKKGYDEKYHVNIIDQNHFDLILPGTKNKIHGEFYKTIQTENVNLTFTKNPFINRKKKFDFIGTYYFIINSRQALIDQVTDKLDVTSSEKDVPIIRISYRSPVAEKSALVANKIAEAYINDYINYKIKSAQNVVTFIDSQLKEISDKLKNSEDSIETYRNKKNIIDFTQETETDLRKISQLKIQLANLTMNQAAIDTLQHYINETKRNFLDLSPIFEAYNDLLSTEMIKKIKDLQLEKSDLLLKYKPMNEKVQVIDRKINDYISYIRESLKSSSKNIEIKKDEIKKTITDAEGKFIGLPGREKHMTILERDFKLNEKIFNFLSEKRTDAVIAEHATMSFHRIIATADIPEVPVSPKKNLIIIFSIFLGLIFGIIFVYVKSMIRGRIEDKADIEKYSVIPIVGSIKNYSKDKLHIKNDFNTLAGSLIFHKILNRHNIIAVSSSLPGEGKSFVAWHLANSLADIGYRTLIVDLNFNKQSEFIKENIHSDLGINDIVFGSATTDQVIQQYKNLLDMLPIGNLTKPVVALVSDEKFLALMKELKQKYDAVILTLPAATLAIETISLLQHADTCLYLLRIGYSQKQYISHADFLVNEYKLNNVYYVMNGAHKATDFSGQYTGSWFSYEERKVKGVVSLIKHYYNFYIR